MTRSAGSNALNALQAQTAPLRAFWARLTPRDRQGLTLVAWLIGGLLVWLIAIQPAWRTVRSAPAELAQLDAQMQTMQRQAADARALREAPGVSASAAVIALQAATARLGTTGRLSLQGDRAVLTLKDAEPDALRQWLTEARTGARARPTEANLARGPGGFSGTLVVAIGGNR